MEEYEMRPEKMGAQSLILRNGVPFDLTGFRQKISQQDFQRIDYPILGGVTYMDIQIGAEQAYLNDVEVWTTPTFVDANGNTLAPAVTRGLTLTEMAGLIYSVEILADSQQMCFINDARFLLSIMNQRKHLGSEEQLHYKEWPEQRNIGPGVGAQISLLDDTEAYGGVTGAYAGSEAPLKRAARAYWMEGLETAKKLGIFPGYGALGSPSTHGENTAQRLCLFKLSDLCLWKAFPTFLLKRGFTIRLQLSTQYALKALDNVSGTVALTGTIAGVNLHASIARLHWTIPDQDHLNMIRDELTAGSGIITFPFHCFFGSNDKTHISQSQSDDISYSGSLIEKTFLTWVNKGSAYQDTLANGSNELVIGLNSGAIPPTSNPYLENAGCRYMPVFQGMDIQIDGKQFPWADGLNNADELYIKSYTEAVDGCSVGVHTDQYRSYKFYTVFDFTGHQNIFLVPTISVDVGEKVNSRFIQLRTRFRAAPQVGSQPHCYIYHYTKRLIEFRANLAMRVII